MKDFILLGDKLAATYKEIWPDVMNGKVHYGYTFPKKFQTPSGKETDQMTGRTRWYTTLPVEKECNLQLTKSYYANPSRYPKYEGFDAIEVGRIKDIPYDYFGVMGVPVGYLDHMHPDFQILGISTGHGGELKDGLLAHQQDLRLNGKEKDSFTRIFIKRNSI